MILIPDGEQIPRKPFFIHDDFDGVFYAQSYNNPEKQFSASDDFHDFNAHSYIDTAKQFSTRDCLDDFDG
ncbi:unnamed protein product, partial [Rotaria socialis]